MKRNLIIIGILSVVFFISCVKDLDVVPKNPNVLLTGNLLDDPAYIDQYLAKVYASFIIQGQGSNGGDDIASGDGAFFTTTRALWNLQELPTDEAICAWSDVGISDLNTLTWTPSNPFLTAIYQRLGLSITYANDFLFTTKDMKEDKIIRYRAEARFLRALAYYWHMDLFGNPPFTTEEDGVGKKFPKQLDDNMIEGRKKLFNYIVTELKDIEKDLGEPGYSYPQADKATCWMLLARIYLNAEVYTGTAKWDSCLIYTNKVIDCGAYELDNNYRRNFSADNGRNDGNKEMIFAWSQDGSNTQGWVGTTFIIQSSSDATYINASKYHGLSTNPNWNGNRATKQFLHVMIDTIKTYNNGPVNWKTDSIKVKTDYLTFTKFPESKDKRVFLHSRVSADITNPTIAEEGIGVYKFTGKLSDGTFPKTFNKSYANTDFPIFRYADALLMKAEASFRLGNHSVAIEYVNKVRERAFGDNSHNISTITEQDILNERAREFYYEAQRRTDLIRFNQFTTDTYLWAWKGGVMNGAATSPNKNVYPIPAEEVSANPEIKQNPGY